jgi:hypothetical protein
MSTEASSIALVSRNFEDLSISVGSPRTKCEQNTELASFAVVLYGNEAYSCWADCTSRSDSTEIQSASHRVIISRINTLSNTIMTSA